VVFLFILSQEIFIVQSRFSFGKLSGIEGRQGIDLKRAVIGMFFFEVIFGLNV